MLAEINFFKPVIPKKEKTFTRVTLTTNRPKKKKGGGENQ